LSSILKNAIKYTALFSIGIGVLYLAFRGQDLSGIWIEIKSANYFWVSISALSVLIAHVLRALRWRLLYHSISYQVSFSHTYHAVIIGYLANLILPRFGELVRCSVIQKTERVPMFASIGTVITERLFDVLVLFISAFSILFFRYGLVSGFIKELINSMASRFDHISYIWLMSLGVVILLAIVIAGYFLRQKFGKKLLRIFVNLRQGFGSYHKMKSKVPFLLYTLLIWFFYFLSMYLSFFSLKATSNLNVDAAFIAMVFSGFAMAAPVQGGIGVFHWMIARALMLFQIAFKDGLAYATIVHSSQFLLILLLGAFSLGYLLFKSRSVKL